MAMHFRHSINLSANIIRLYIHYTGCQKKNAMEIQQAFVHHKRN